MLQVNFIMIYIIYEISVLFKYQNSKTVFKEYNRLFLKKNKKKSQLIMMESSRLEEKT